MPTVGVNRDACGLTPPSSGRPKGRFAPFAPPLMSNVRPHKLDSCTSMEEDNASMLGFLAAPLIPGVAFALSSQGLGGGPNAGMGTLAGLALLGYVFALLFTGLFALPAFLLLRWRGHINLLSSVVAGAAVGVIVSVVVLLPPSSPLSAWLGAVRESLPFTGCVGASAGAVFWLVRRSCMSIGSIKGQATA